MAEYKPRNYRLVRHVTRTRILDVQDCLEIGKLRIEVVEFEPGKGATRAAEHYAEPDAVALLSHDMLHGRPWETYTEFKGGVRDGKVESRVLCIERVEARNPIKITVSRGPGEKTGTGAVKPAGKPEVSVSVLLSDADARRVAHMILRHMAAWEAATYHQRVEAGTRWAGGEEEPPAASAPAPVAEQAPRPDPEPARKLHWSEDPLQWAPIESLCGQLRVSDKELRAWFGSRAAIAAEGRTCRDVAHAIRAKVFERNAKRDREAAAR